jgi:hypothetical protein
VSWGFPPTDEGAGDAADPGSTISGTRTRRHCSPPASTQPVSERLGATWGSRCTCRRPVYCQFLKPEEVPPLLNVATAFAQHVLRVVTLGQVTAVPGDFGGPAGVAEDARQQAKREFKARGLSAPGSPSPRTSPRTPATSWGGPATSPAPARPLCSMATGLRSHHHQRIATEHPGQPRREVTTVVSRPSTSSCRSRPAARDRDRRGVLGHRPRGCLGGPIQPGISLWW